MSFMKKKSKTSSLESQPEISETAMAEITHYQEIAKKAILKAESRKEATPVVRLFVTAKVKNDPTKQRPAVTLINTLKKDKNSKPFSDLFQKVCKATTIRLFFKLSWSKIKNNPDHWLKVCKSLKTELEDFCKKIENLHFIDDDFKDTMKKCLEIITQHGKDAYERRTKIKNAYKNLLDIVSKSKDFNYYVESELKNGNWHINHQGVGIEPIETNIKELLLQCLYGNDCKNTGYESIGTPMTDLIKDETFENNNAIIKVLAEVKSQALDLIIQLDGYLSTKKFNLLQEKIKNLFDNAVDSLKKAHN